MSLSDGSAKYDAAPAALNAKYWRIQTLEPEPWMSEVAAVGHATRKIQPLTIGQTLREIAASSLRTREGISRTLWSEVLIEHSLNVPLTTLVKSEKCREFISSGFLILDEEGLRLSDAGIAVADHVTAYVIADLDEALDRVQ